MNYYAISAFSNGLLALVISAYVFLRNPRNKLNRSYLWFGISIGGWSLFYSFWCLADNRDTAFLFLKTHMTFCAFIYPSLFYFAVTFSGLYERFKFYVITFYLLAIFFAVTCHNGWLIADVRKIMFFEYWPKGGPILAIHVAWASVVVLFALFVIVYKMLTSFGDERKKTIWILIALLIGFGGGFVNWFLWFDILIPPITNGFVGIQFIILGYVIVRYRLMDVDVMVDLLRANRNAHLGMMAASINHEIKSPLFVMQGLAQSYRSNLDDHFYGSKEEVDTALRELCHKVEREVVKIQKIIKQFSEFTKVDSLSDQLHEKVHLAGLAQRVVDLLKLQAYAQKVAYTIEISDDLSVQASKQHLEEVFYNLISNAIQAFQNQEGVISIRAEAREESLEIIVQDNGPGISKKKLPQIFEPFYTTKEEGTGLGLYITKQLVERNGGTIKVESKLGGGTQFTIELPKVLS
jgi:signal transduction histidine kinase